MPESGKNLEEIDIFLNICNISKLSHDDIENLKRSTIKTENESVIKTLPTNKSSGAHGFAAEPHQTYQNEHRVLMYRTLRAGKQ